MSFRAIADLPLAGEAYAEGWQTWSGVDVYRPGQTSPRASDARAQTVMFRPGKPVPEGVIQAEGVLAVAAPGEPARAWFAPHPDREVPTLRLREKRDRWEVSADGDVEAVTGATLRDALEAVGDRLGIGSVRSVPPGWSTWSYYFKDVTEQDVVENVEAAKRLELPIEIVQLDDGYESDIGDWLDVRPAFGSVERLAHRITEAGTAGGHLDSALHGRAQQRAGERAPGLARPGPRRGPALGPGDAHPRCHETGSRRLHRERFPHLGW